MKALLKVCLLCLLSSSLMAKSSVELIPVIYTDPSTLIDSIRPFISEHTVLQSHKKQIIVKGDEESVKTVMMLVQKLDKPLKLFELTIHYGQLNQDQATSTFIQTNRQSDKKTQYQIKLQDGGETIIRQDRLMPVILNASGQHFSSQLNESTNEKQDVSTQRLGEIASTFVFKESEVAQLETQRKALEINYNNATTNAARAAALAALDVNQQAIDRVKREIKQLQAEFAELKNSPNKVVSEMSKEANFKGGGYQKQYQQLPSGLYLGIQSQGQSLLVSIKNIDSAVQAKGNIAIEKIETKLSVPMNEWVRVSGHETMKSNQRSISTQRANESQQEIWLKVRAISNGGK